MSLLKTLWRMPAFSRGAPARFVLRYMPRGDRPLVVGVLRFDGEMWEFGYSDEYKQRPELRPIEGFDDVHRVYRSSALFPFFAVRIPDVERADVKRRLREEHVREPQAPDLLRLFGRKVVSSPAFELEPA